MITLLPLLTSFIVIAFSVFFGLRFKSFHLLIFNIFYVFYSLWCPILLSLFGLSISDISPTYARDIGNINVSSLAFASTIVDYCLFALLFNLAFFLILQKSTSTTVISPLSAFGFFYINIKRIFFLSLIALFASLLLLFSSLSLQYLATLNIYNYSRLEGGLPNYNLSRILSDLSLFSTAIGIYLLLSETSSRKSPAICHSVLSHISKRSLSLYISLFSLVAFLNIFLCLILGNRSPLLFVFLFSFLLASTNVSSYRHNLKILLATILFFFVLYLIAVFRGVSFVDWSNVYNSSFGSSGFADALSSLFISSEVAAPFASLYNVYCDNTQPLFAHSFIYLLISFLPFPKSYLLDHLPNSYALYADNSLSSALDHGYTIHYVAALYLNGYEFFVYLGAIATGLAFLFFFTLSLSSRHNILLYNRFSLSLYLSSFALFASTPILLRNGPEGIKGIVISALIYPMLVVYAAFDPRRLRYQSKPTPVVLPTAPSS